MRHVSMSLATLFAVGAATMSSAVVHAAPVFDKEIACYKALLGKAWGANYDLDGTILIPATRAGKKGFYLYSETGSYFHAFPTVPATSGMSYYYFELRVPGKKPHFITYSFDAAREDNPGIGSSAEPLPANQGKYRVLSGGDALDDASRASFTNDLQTRIKTVASTYSKRLERSKVDRKFTPDKARFEAALDSCGKIDNKELKETVVAERAALAKVNPPVGNSGSSSEGSSAAPAR